MSKKSCTKIKGKDFLVWNLKSSSSSLWTSLETRYQIALYDQKTCGFVVCGLRWHWHHACCHHTTCTAAVGRRIAILVWHMRRLSFGAKRDGRRARARARRQSIFLRVRPGRQFLRSFVIFSSSEKFPVKFEVDR